MTEPRKTTKDLQEALARSNERYLKFIEAMALDFSAYVSPVGSSFAQVNMAQQEARARFDRQREQYQRSLKLLAVHNFKSIRERQWPHPKVAHLRKCNKYRARRQGQKPPVKPFKVPTDWSRPVRLKDIGAIGLMMHSRQEGKTHYGR